MRRLKAVRRADVPKWNFAKSETLDLCEVGLQNEPRMKRFLWNVVALIALVVIVIGVVFSSSANALRKDAAPAEPAGPVDRSASVPIN